MPRGALGVNAMMIMLLKRFVSSSSSVVIVALFIMFLSEIRNVAYIDSAY